MATYYEKNREYCIALAREYQLEHKEYYKQYQKEYYQRNKVFLLEARRLRAKQRPPKIRKPNPNPKPRGRPPKAPEDKKPKEKRRPFFLQREEVVIETIEPEETPQVVWVSDKDFVCSFD